MTKDEALKLALEAIELHLMHHEHGCTYLGPVVPVIKEVLAQPERKLNPNDSFERDEAAAARVREFMRNH